MKKNHNMHLVWLLLFSILFSHGAFAQEMAEIVPSPSTTSRRVLWFQDFEDGKTANWQCTEGSPDLIQVDGSTVYQVQKYDYVNFENVEKLVNFRMECNIKFFIPEQMRGKAWPALYIKSLNPTQRYEIFFESLEGSQGVTLRRNGVDTLTIPMDFYQYNDQWVYLRVDVEGDTVTVYLDDPTVPILTYVDSAPLVSGPLGFVRGNTDYFYLDNLLITARPLAAGEEDTAFTDIAPIPPKTENTYGQTYLDTDFSQGLDSALLDPYHKTTLIETENGPAAQIAGELYVGDNSWKNYSIEMDLSLENRQFLESDQPFFKFRCTDENNYYMFRTNAAGSVLQIYKAVDGSMEWVGQKVFYLGSGRTLQLRLDVYDSSIRFYARSTSYPNFEYPLLTLSDSSHSSGGIAFCKPEYLDNIRLYQLRIRQIQTLGNIGPRPDPVPLSNPVENPALSWNDINGHWSWDCLRLLGSIGAMSGYPDGTFRPDDPLTLEEAIAILCKASGIEVERSNIHWSDPYLQAALSRGYLTAEDLSRADQPVSRGKLAQIIATVMGKEPGDLSGILQGDDSGALNLEKITTRAEAAAMIARLYTDVLRPQDHTAIVRFEEYPLAFANPYKGFRNAVGDPYGTLVQCNLYWNQLENSKEDGVEKILEYADSVFEGFPENNCKAIIRVLLEFPPNLYWPSDMTAGDYSSDEFCQRVRNLVQKLALAFDNDPRVAFVQMGIVGKWGEMQDPGPTPKVAQVLTESFHEFFKNKLVQTNIIPHMGMFQEYEFGTHWDSYGHWDNLSLLDVFEAPYFQDIWKRCPTNGEAAFDWGEPLGKNPNDAVINQQKRYIDIIRGTHCTSLGWISRYDKKDPDTTRNAVDIQKALGYRFVLQNAKYTQRLSSGEDLQVGFTVTNTGSAPIYYNEPIELSLLHPDTHEVVWSTTFQNTDIRTWLPDDDYSITPVYTVSGTFTLPENLPQGIYTLALSILDKEGGNVPSVRFANTNYYQGGRHPIGNIAVDTDAPIPPLDQSQFADLFTDRLYYLYDKSSK